MPASPAPDDRDQQIRDALRGVTAATAGPVEQAARTKLEAKPQDPVALGTLAGCALIRARLPGGRGPDDIARADSWDGRQALAAYQAAWNARQTAPGLSVVNAAYARAIALGPRVPELTEMLKSWPNPYFTPEVQSALGSGLSTLAPKQEGETALIIAEMWQQRFPEDAEVHRQLVEIWWSGGELDRAAKAIESWKASAAPGEWAMRRAEIALLREGPAAARAALAGVTAPGAEALATCIAGALGEDAAVPALQALAAKGDPGRPGAMFLARALWHSVGPAGADAKPELMNRADILLEARAFPEAQLALIARRRLGDWNDAQTLMQADLWRKMREWKREIDTIKPMTERVDRDGITTNGISAGDHHFRLGRASYHQKLYDVATHEYELAAKAGKEDPELWFHIAKLLTAEGREKEALEWLQKSASWHARPHAEKARSELAREAKAAPGSRAAQPFGASPYLAPPPPSASAASPSPSPAR